MEKASTYHSEKELVEALLAFKCCKDLDVQEFLNNKAIDFEKGVGQQLIFYLQKKSLFGEK